MSYFNKLHIFILCLNWKRILFVILTKLLNVLGILRAKGVDECDLETIASEWFRLSKLRYDRESKKKVLADDRDAHQKET